MWAMSSVSWSFTSCPSDPFLALPLFSVAQGLSLENYSSQVPLLTGFLLGSANGMPWWEFGGGRKREARGFLPVSLL